MTRVLHVITGLGNGGAERQLAGLVRMLPEPGEVVTLTNPGPVADLIREAGAPVHHLGRWGNRDLAALPRLVRLIRAGRFDVVHVHLYRAQVFGRLAARLAGVRAIVSTEHSLGATEIEGRRVTAGVRALYRASERLGTITVAVSDTVAGRLRAWGVPDRRIVVIPNGLDTAAFAFDPERRARTRARLGIGPDERVVGTVGRLVPGKRVDLLVDACAGTDLRLVVAGDGPERAELEQRAASSTASSTGSRAVFSGDTSDVPGVLAALDVYAAPSAQETFGLGVLEALAAGLPVRYTDCPALTDRPAHLAPQAAHVPEHVDAAGWRTELHTALAGIGDRRPAPVTAHYDLAAQAAATAGLYARLVDAPGALNQI